MGLLIEGERLAKLYGRRPERAAALLRDGALRRDVERQTRCTVGVEDVSLGVERGELHVLMGLSGSGKSTVLRMLNGLVEPTAGRVSFDGRPLADHDPRELRDLRNRRIAMVFQHFALLPHRTVRENASYGLRIRGVAAAEARERADEALRVVGLEGWGDERPAALSGGMKQRVGLARALATDAEVLLMDEPFSALDPVIRREMQDLLLTLRDTIDRTVVFVTHDLDEALRLGDRITLLGAGLVEQAGTPAEVLTRPANDYVRRFVGGIDRSRVLTARDLMRPVPDEVGVVAGAGATGNGAVTPGALRPAGTPTLLRPVAPGASLVDVAASLGDGGAPVAVVEDGRTLGEVTPGAVLAALAATRDAA